MSVAGFCCCLCICSAQDPTQGLTHVGQAFHHWVIWYLLYLCEGHMMPNNMRLVLVAKDCGFNGVGLLFWVWWMKTLSSSGKDNCFAGWHKWLCHCQWDLQNVWVICPYSCLLLKGNKSAYVNECHCQVKVTEMLKCYFVLSQSIFCLGAYSRPHGKDLMYFHRSS